MATRRELKPFASFDAAVAEVDMLHSGGYNRAGNWSLGQVCGHLANWLDYQQRGFPPLPLFLKPVFFIVRNTMANKMMRDVIARGTMPAGSSTAPQSIPPATVDDATELNRLKTAYRDWENYTGPLVPSPLFGVQTKDDWRKLHLVHAAHHLSFLIPNQTRS